MIKNLFKLACCTADRMAAEAELKRVEVIKEVSSIDQAEVKRALAKINKGARL